MSHLPRTPATPPVFDPNDPRYWEPRDLEHELRRTFQICHECRMCVTYCGSFPILFDAVDRDIESGRAEGAERIGPETISEVTDHCWQCKLCFIKCPYTEDEGARELPGFPPADGPREGPTRSPRRHRHRRSSARRAAARGLGGRRSRRALGELRQRAAPGAQGHGADHRHQRRVPAAAAGAGALQSVASVRTTRPSRQAPPARSCSSRPATASTTSPRSRGTRCSCSRRTATRSRYPRRSPAAACRTSTAATSTRPSARCSTTWICFCPHVRRGATIVVPGPTCGYTMKKEWPVYLGSAEAKEVAAATLESDGVPGRARARPRR